MNADTCNILNEADFAMTPKNLLVPLVAGSDQSRQRDET